ncbi:inhibitor of growth protein 4-like [Dysidea avara]|uniref:inhibitor of growth protein 4-like n=1 Tax=Dysidea avara TaxID=196820 RepID=UPI003330A50E
MASAAFLEKYFDCVNFLPRELQSSISELREIELKSKIEDLLAAIEQLQNDSFDPSRSYAERRRSFAALWQKVLEVRQIGDQKLELTSTMLETAEEYSRRLDISVKNMDKSRQLDDYFLNSIATIPRPESVASNTNSNDHLDKSKRSSKGRPKNEKEKNELTRELRDDDKSRDTPNNKPPRKRLRVNRNKGKLPGVNSGHSTNSSQNLLPSPTHLPMPDLTSQPLDPNEPTYCLCEQVSFGEMIGCDKEDCPIEWFHFQCVGLTSKPKGKWYCPLCKPDQKGVKNNKQ